MFVSKGGNGVDIYRLTIYLNGEGSRGPLKDHDGVQGALELGPGSKPWGALRFVCFRVPIQPIIPGKKFLTPISLCQKFMTPPP